MVGLVFFSSEASHAEHAKHTAAMMNVVEKPRKNEVNPETTEPNKVATPTNAL